jgi:hypothetical protein
VNKRYVAINRSSLILIAKLPENKGQLSIEFQSGYGMKREAYFMTDKKEIQDVLEADKRFNNSYRLEEIDNIPVIEYEFRQAQKKDTKIEESELETITFGSINEAKDFLVSKGIEKKKIPNPAAIANRGKELGFNIEIINITE